MKNQYCIKSSLFKMLEKTKMIEKNKKKYHKPEYGKIWLIRELARRANFTIEDSDLIINTLVGIVQDIVSQKKSLIISGLFKMEVKKVLYNDKWDNINKRYMGKQEGYKITFHPTTKLRSFTKL
jgi:hypothetical protein